MKNLLHSTRSIRSVANFNIIYKPTYLGQCFETIKFNFYKRNMIFKTSVFYLLFTVFLLNGLNVFAQTTLIGWDCNPIINGSNLFGPSPFSPSTVHSNIIGTSFIRGAGVNTTGVGVDRAFGGLGFNSVNATTAIAANKFFTFTIASSAGHIMSISSIDPIKYRRSSTGPPNALIQYSINGGSFVNISTINFPNTSSAGDVTNFINLSSFSDLQNLPSSSIVSFRIIPFGASNSTGSWYIYDVSNSTSTDFEIKGTTSLNLASLNTGSLNFVNCPGSNAIQSLIISGNNLLGSPIVIGPFSTFKFSTNPLGPFTNTLSLSYVGTSLNSTVYVQYLPTQLGSVNGSIPVIGGGATDSIVISATAVNPVVIPTSLDDELCPGESTSLSAGTNQIINSLLTEIGGTNGVSGNVFDVHAYNNITITDFKMVITSGDSAEVWYNPGGYGNANVTSSAGWTKLGATVPITAAGIGNLTTIPTTVNLTLSAGSTYGIIILCNGSNRYTNGTTVGSFASSNSDLYITEGHGGSGGFGSPFSFTLSPRKFNGTVEYTNNFINYSWAPAATLSNATSANTIATPSLSTTYTVTATDGNGCTATGIKKIYRYSNPITNPITATPASICAGSTSQLNIPSSISNSTQSLFTTLAGGNSNAAIMFDVHALNNITITNVSANILSGDSAQVWYKTTPYGNASVTSSVGWTKLGNTVAITPAGAGALTLIPTTANLSIPADSTYGFAVITNGSLGYSNGTTVGNVAYSSPDLEITEGHGGAGFNGVFNFVNVPRVFNGQIFYSVTNNPFTHSWSPSNTLSNSTISNPIADPLSNTEYRLILTDIHGCKDTAFKTLYVNRPAILNTTVTPISICPGDSALLNLTANVNERDSLSTTTEDNNSNGGNAFDIITSKAVIIRSFKMNIDTGATQAEVWYKIGGYGNANYTGTAGWTKLGATVSITPAGVGNLTNIPITASLPIPSGATYGFMVVSNSGKVKYTDGTTVGAVYKSNPDLSITQGHGGTGIGSYSFSAASRIWNGEVVYDAVNAVTGYVWTPNTNMNNANASNTKAAPLSTTIYSVTATDINGCTSEASAAVILSPLPALGTATATPASLCLGNNVSLAYTPPAGLSCFGAIQSGFGGTFAPANWTLTQTPAAANGTVNTAAAPSSITMTSSNGASGSGTTSYTITIPCNGVISFNWSYSTIDAGPQYDVPRYSLNGGAAVVFPGFIGLNGAPKTQSGVFNMAVTAGQTFSLQAHTSDNLGGSCSVVISSFKAPYQTTSGQSVVWFNAPTGGSNIGSANPQSHTPLTSNTFTYYARVTSSVTSCTNATRVATNSVEVNPIPGIGTTASLATICQGSSSTLTATGASTYTWQPGGLNGSSVNVSPATTTTYTVTGTNAQGCTATAIRTITVNPAPVITGSAAPGIVCPGGTVTLTGTTPGVTWNWQPGNLSGSPVVVNPIVQTTYTVTATSALGCNKSQTFVILMNTVPAVATTVVPISSSFCAGGSATITATGATSYVWQPGNVSGATLSTTTANTYTITGTNAQGCTATATRVITVFSLPTVGTTASATTICEGSSSTLTGSGAISYVWNPGALSGTSVVVSPLTTTTYTVIGTNVNGCTNSTTRLITVNPAPEAIGNAAPSLVCSGDAVTLNAANAGATFNWQPGNLNGSPVVVNPIVQTTYTVTATYANSCSRTTTIVVLINPSPNITLGVVPASGTICTDSSASITASGAISYAWQPGSLSGATVNVNPATTTIYTITATNANGCTNTATSAITVVACDTCASNIVISTSPYSVLLTKSQTFIRTNGTVLIDSGAIVEFDAAPTSYVLLDTGFLATKGSVFLAHASIGCTTSVPQPHAKESNLEIGGVENYDETIVVYPNPTTGKIRIEHPITLGEIKVFDLTGKVLMKIKTLGNTKSDIDIGHLAQGIYLLYAEGFSNIKVIKN